MSTMNSGTKWNDTVTIDKQSGTKIAIETDGTYVEKDIELTINVQAGSAATPNTDITVSPVMSVASNTGVLTVSVDATQSVSPTVTPGYVSSGSAGTITVSGTGSMQLPTHAAQTIVPGTSNQIIEGWKYLTGSQVIVGDSNLVSSNIKVGSSIFNVAGTFTNEATVSTGQTAATSNEILSGHSAWVNGEEVRGAMEIATVAETIEYLNTSSIAVASGVSF